MFVGERRYSNARCAYQNHTNGVDKVITLRDDCSTCELYAGSIYWFLCLKVRFVLIEERIIT